MRRLKTALWLMFLFCASSQTVMAQVIDPVKWSFNAKQLSKTEVQLELTATMDKGWHLYALDLPEGGPIPTAFTFEKGMGFFTVGKVVQPKPHSEMDKNFNMVVNYFSGTVTFTQKVRVASATPVEVKGTIEYMCCNDEQCLPPKEVPFTFKLAASK